VDANEPVGGGELLQVVCGDDDTVPLVAVVGEELDDSAGRLGLVPEQPTDEDP
jgi:hypothetical protein